MIFERTTTYSLRTPCILSTSGWIFEPNVSYRYSIYRRMVVSMEVQLNDLECAEDEAGEMLRSHVPQP